MKLETALEKMKEAGFKNTAKRREILEFFLDEERYISARDVLEDMKSRHDGLSYDTVYRNLATFAEIGLLEMTELDGEKRFRLTCETPHHHHHMICLACGRTEHVNACPMDSVEMDNTDFSITAHKFEIYGHCADCNQHEIE
ncbi:Fur family zinc uptake regulator [Salsuginibacillus halophilus]|uniref:Fur family zinc uptake regulator n=1 Tax=Salsuginibacillus halophilus TaxID=517424 RepID=A0A2P8HFK7_9BACI|nr:Fur family transcriptional regulator [Salsuginibacillus halophilus]PSL44997.1 Fur family zinc uptake regulator [Salsuginibacillus halophilus]